VAVLDSQIIPHSKSSIHLHIRFSRVTGFYKIHSDSTLSLVSGSSLHPHPLALQKIRIYLRQHGAPTQEQLSQNSIRTPI
jgi:hypothetical protein